MLDPAAYRAIDVVVDSATAVAVLTLNRPDKANAVDDVMHSELSRVFAVAQDDDRDSGLGFLWRGPRRMRGVGLPLAVPASARGAPLARLIPGKTAKKVPERIGAIARPAPVEEMGLARRRD